MKWEQLLCEKRNIYENGTRHSGSYENRDLRTEFQKDYHRIIGSASFRRLQDKTQVFPLDNSDFVRTRLTHSLETASFAKSLGRSSFNYIMSHKGQYNKDFLPEEQDVEKICSILECAGLIHDIGNPPFGHFGEFVIGNWFKENLSKIYYKNKSVTDVLSEFDDSKQLLEDLYEFEGNAQALRLLTKLHYLVDERGMHLTYALLNTIIKYPVNSCKKGFNKDDIKYKKFGYYYSETEQFNNIVNNTGAIAYRYPLTYLLEAADDIAYRTADIEDAVKKGYISYYMLEKELDNEKYREMCSGKERENYKRCVEKLKEKLNISIERNVPSPELNAIQNWIVSIQGYLINCAVFGFTNNYNDIMAGKFKSEILKVSFANTLMKAFSDITKKYVFQSSHIQKSEISAETIIDFLLDIFIKAIVHYDTGIKLNPLEERVINLISSNYVNTYKHYSKGKKDEEKLYLRILLVTDYICGMTDTYAKNLYQELSGIK